MNLHILKGNLGRDPELTYTPAGDAVCKFSIAVAHPYHPKDKEKTTWANCVAWRKTAENIAKFFKKGNQIIVWGFTEERKWEKDGQKHSMMQTTVDRFEFCGSVAGGPGRTTDTDDDGGIPF